jgi:hypothetical protein
MKNSRLKELQAAAEKARRNWIETRSEISYNTWQRLLREIEEEKKK